MHNARLQILKHLTAGEAIEKYGDELTPFEKSELSMCQFVYTIGSVRVKNAGSKTNTDGFYLMQKGE